MQPFQDIVQGAGDAFEKSHGLAEIVGGGRRQDDGQSLEAVLAEDAVRAFDRGESLGIDGSEGHQQGPVLSRLEEPQLEERIKQE